MLPQLHLDRSMRVLFDHGAPRGLAVALPRHEVVRARSLGWEQLSNGDLLSAAEEAGFQVLVTTDSNIRYQQNLANRRIALVVLTGSTKWSRVRERFNEIAAAVEASIPGGYTEVRIPPEERRPRRERRTVLPR
jgi:hypothetical protein